MRIYEIAKIYNVSSKEILHVLRDQGLSFATHMSVLDDQAVALLEAAFSKKQKKKDDIEKNDTIPSLVETKKDDTSKKEAIHTKESGPVNVSSQINQKIQEKQSHQRSFEPRAEGITQSVQESIVKKDKELNESFFIEAMTVGEFVSRTKTSLNDVIVQLLKWGLVTTKNYLLKEEIVARLATHFNIAVVAPQSKHTLKPTAIAEQNEESRNVHLREIAHYTEKRNPIIVVIGHVDHGKTTLLDFIRKTRVAAKEKGGITQHIGAYQAKTTQGTLVFIDTPGHEAFMKIRQRGLRVADIAVLVIAADDGIMPQTVEAIKQAKAMNLTIIVAINKIDRVNSDQIEMVKKQLVQYDLLSEDWGGDIMCIPISAKLGKGVDHLLEMIALQADMMELKTDSTASAKGHVLETKVERGRGVVATVICYTGTLHLGDHFVAGAVTGKIVSMMDSFGKSVEYAAPTMPVQIAGFDASPKIGESFRVISKIEYMQMKNNSPAIEKGAHIKAIQQEGALQICIKTDTESSKEAILDLVATINKKAKKQLNVVSATIGTLNESDIEAAYNSTAHIIVMHTRVDSRALALAHIRKVKLHTFDVIYHMHEYLKNWVAAESNETVIIRKKIGLAEVLRVFDIKGIGVIAGSVVKDGRFVKDGIIIALRQGTKVGEGKIVSLQRDRKTVKEVHTGFECGFMVEGITDWQVGDFAECYINQTEIQQYKN